MDYFPFADIIGCFGVCEPLRLHRCQDGTYNKGHYVPGTSQVYALTDTAIRPMSARSEDMLPEGARVHNSMILWTKETLWMSEEGDAGNKSADRIEYQGDFYEVKSRKNYADYFKYIIVRCSDDRLV